MLQLTCQQCRDADRIAIERYGIPGAVLMENAGRGCAEALRQAVEVDACVVVCGPGNNGGDGFVIARYLSEAGCRVKVLMCAPLERYQNDARIHLNVLGHLNVPMIELGDQWTEAQIENEMSYVRRHATDCIVDALLGTGTRGAPRSPIDHVIEIANRLPVFRLAVDVPSGLDADTGQAAGAVFDANLTCTFIAHKPGVVSGKPHIGQVQLIDIGLPAAIVASVADKAMSRSKLSHLSDS